jgi:hypothetical protein
MEHHANNNAPALSLLSILSSILSWISLAEAQYLLSFGVTLIGIVSGLMAIRYYYYAGNEKKQNLKNQ